MNFPFAVFLVGPMLDAMMASIAAMHAAKYAARAREPLRATVVRQVHVTPLLLTHEPHRQE